MKLLNFTSVFNRNVFRINILMKKEEERILLDCLPREPCEEPRKSKSQGRPCKQDRAIYKTGFRKRKIRISRDHVTNVHINLNIIIKHYYNNIIKHSYYFIIFSLYSIHDFDT